MITRTSAKPAIPPGAAGATAVIWVSESTVKLVAGVWLVPFTVVCTKVTAVAPVNAVPVIVIVVPPAIGPRFGEMLVTVGVGT